MKSHLLKTTVILILGIAFLNADKNARKDLPRELKGFKLIPAGKLTYHGTTKTINSFYMSEGEVTNGQYMEFLRNLKAQGRMEAYRKAMLDTAQWRNEFGPEEPYADTYHHDAAYRDYPAVNMSKEGVELYCQWLTEKYKDSGLGIAHFRLPLEEEWVYAAKGGNADAIFPWEGYSLRDPKKGWWRCNFYYINQAVISMDPHTKEISLKSVPSRLKIINEDATITAPSVSYWPNGYGLFNMAGNVAEMLQEKGRTKGGSYLSTGYYVRIDAEDEYEGFTGGSPYIGFRPVMTYTGK